MKKLKLAVDALRVQTFEVAGEDAKPRGTVQGHQSDSTCIERNCGCHADSEFDLTCATCDMLQDTCYNTCPTYHNCPTTPGYPGC